MNNKQCVSAKNSPGTAAEPGYELEHRSTYLPVSHTVSTTT